MKDFKGKVAAVTGAASGIGLACAEAFARAGMSVALMDNRADELETASERVRALGGVAIGIVTDVSDERAVEAAAAQTERVFGKINLIMNNAAVFIRGHPIEAVRDDVWDWLLKVNLYGTLHGIRSFVPRMRASGEVGRVVNTASISGLYVSERLNSVYAASKFAIVAVSEGLGHDLKGSGIGVSVVAPGPVSSDFYVTSAQHRGDLGGPNLFPTTPPDTAAGMTPDEVARRVLAGIAADQFYIPTHTATRAHVQRRHDRIMEGYDFMAAWEKSEGI
ncbi:MAG: SDR family NAD(P)-dependent oxidoreductase [Caulobacteraceae bacterium]